MKVIFGSKLYVIIEKEDTKISKNVQGDSSLMYQLKNLLNQEGFNMIKKRMWKDGHMTDESNQYIRQSSTAKKTDPHFYIYDSETAVYYIKERFDNVTENLREVIKDTKDTDRYIGLSLSSSLDNDPDNSWIAKVKQLADKSDKVFYTRYFRPDMF